MTRLFLLVSAPIAIASAFVLGWWALAIGGALGVHAIARARGVAGNIGCAVLADRVLFRTGWLHRVVSVARFERLQSASFGQTLFDRRTGMARVGVDTAGLGGSSLSMSYLPESTALRLQNRLAGAAADTPFTW